MIVRCRKCWDDVAELKVRAGKTPVIPKCPKCGKAETYIHARKVTGSKPLRDQEADDGSTGPG